MSRYNFDGSILAKWNLPEHERKSIVQAYIKTGLKRIRTIQNLFVGKVAEWDLLAKFSPGARIQLQEFLRLKYVNNEIAVVNNTPSLVAFWAFDDNDPRATFVFDDDDSQAVFAFDDDAVNPSEANFIVQMPSAVNFDIDMLRAQVSRYTRAGQTFDIEIIL